MFGRRRAPSDFSAELEAHLNLEIDRLRAEGLNEHEAYAQARRNLGNLGVTGERFYESHGWLWIEHLRQDTRLALRRLRQAPVFALTAVLTLALGIGATTAIFTLVHAVMMRSLAVEDPAQLYRLGRETHCCVWGGYGQGSEFSIVSYDLYKHFRDHTQGFAELAAFEAGQTTLGVRRAGSGNVAEGHIAEFVSGNYFAMFGVRPWAGRTLTNEDDREGAPPVAMMSYRLWRQKYGLDPAVIGGVFQLNGQAFVIAGITPPAFFGETLRGTTPDFFLPLAMEPLLHGDSSLLHAQSSHWLDLIGRICPGASVAAIQAQMRVELQQWLRSHWGEMDANTRAELPRQTLYLSPGGAGITTMRERYERWLKILMMVAGLVLLIVCANVANLLLVRGMEQRQQTSLSIALGAGRMRLIRQALTESVVLSVLGGAAGLLVAYAGTRLILHFTFNSLPGFAGVPIDAAPSFPVLGFAFAVSLATGVIFGIAPAWMATRVDPIEALRGAHRSSRRAGSLPRRTLIVIQAALSLVLLVASGLLTTALRKLEHQDFGFAQEGRTIVNIDPVLARYQPQQLDSLYRGIHDSLMNIPGVAAVALCGYSPLSGDSWNDWVFVAGRPAPGPREDHTASWVRVTSGYFESLGIPVIKGRPIDDRDTAGSPHVAVISESFARRYFKGEDPIGKHFGKTDIATARDLEVVGVVKDLRYLTYGFDQVRPFFFVPATQSTIYKADDTAGDVRSRFLHDIVVRTRPGAPLGESDIRRAMAAVNPNMPVTQVQSLAEQVASVFRQQRLIARLTSLFGLLSLVLSCIGLYGVTAYNATSRTSEIGVRMALGANRGQVVSLILWGAIPLIGGGLVLGVPLALGAGRLLDSQLNGVSPYNAAIIAGAIAALAAAALVASVIPAWRASTISPFAALRAE